MQGWIDQHGWELLGGSIFLLGFFSVLARLKSLELRIKSLEKHLKLIWQDVSREHI